MSAETPEEQVPVQTQDDQQAEPGAVDEQDALGSPEVGQPDAGPAQAGPMGETGDHEVMNDMTEAELEEARANEVAFSWQASEYVQHHKGSGWYMLLFAVLGVAILVAVLLQLWFFIGVVVMGGIAILIYAKKPPKTLLYELTPEGIQIDGKKHPFSELRSFGVQEGEDWHSIELLPAQRLSPPLSILFNRDDIDEIVGHLELHLPRADVKPDVIDRVTRFLRF